MTEPTPLSALREWLLHPDRSYTPHELAMEAVRRLDAARATVPAGPDLDTLEIAVLDASTREFPAVRKAMIRRAFAETRAARPVPAADDRAALMTIYGLVTDEPWTPTMRDSIEAIAGRALSRAGVSPSTGDAE
jgi:hypothetical protein